MYASCNGKQIYRYYKKKRENNNDNIHHHHELITVFALVFLLTNISPVSPVESAFQDSWYSAVLLLSSIVKVASIILVSAFTWITVDMFIAEKQPIRWTPASTNEVISVWISHKLMIQLQMVYIAWCIVRRSKFLSRRKGELETTKLTLRITLTWWSDINAETVPGHKLFTASCFRIDVVSCINGCTVEVCDRYVIRN